MPDSILLRGENERAVKGLKSSHGTGVWQRERKTLRAAQINLHCKLLRWEQFQFWRNLISSVSRLLDQEVPFSQSTGEAIMASPTL